MVNASSIIRYFKDCYDADNRRGTIWNIFHRDVTHRVFLDGEEDLLTGSFPIVSIDEEKGDAAAKAAFLARKERELLYCSIMIVGSTGSEEGGDVRHLCAPLLMHPVRIEEGEQGHRFLRPEWEERKINYRLLSAINDDEGGIDLVVDLLRDRHITANGIGLLMSALESLDQRIDATPLYQYPKLVGEDDLRAMLPSDGGAAGTLTVLPAAMIGLFKKSVETRGVLNELTMMADGMPLSAPVRELLVRDGAQSRQEMDRGEGYIPAVLSDAQQRVLRSAATNPLTVVIGPPGTGKSYTIAALAVEHMSRGESVLIASKINHAVDVVGNKIEKQLGVRGCVIRAGRKDYRRELKKNLQALLNGIAKPAAAKDVRRLKREVAALDKSIASLEAAITKRCARERSWGATLAADGGGLLDRLRRRYVRWRVRREIPLSRSVDDLETLLSSRSARTTQLIEGLNGERIDEVLRKHRVQLSTFLNAIRARTGDHQEALFSYIDFRILFRALPLWLVNLSDIHDVLPLTGELFDLAIIDEATQCDIASCLPIFQRARRVVITGDPNQLRHLSFLSRDQQRAFVEKHGLGAELGSILDYREKSILDLMSDSIEDQERVIFLNEHYRSVPEIIGFSNETFYQGALAIMTERPRRGDDEGIVVARCSGEQSPSGENETEARMIVEQVRSYMEHEGGSPQDRIASIGILSPFRRQADYIAALLAEDLSLDAFERHDIMIGTPYTFQGEERDVMLLSMVVDDGSHGARLRFIDRPDAFNVAVTRARRIQHVYSSLTHRKLGDALLGRYLDYADEQRRRGKTNCGKEERSADRFMLEVAGELERLGHMVWKECGIAGTVVDLVIEREGRLYGIDLIGYPGGSDAPLPLERYRMFHRAGLRVVPMAYSQWRIDREKCVQRLTIND